MDKLKKDSKTEYELKIQKEGRKNYYNCNTF